MLLYHFLNAKYGLEAIKNRRLKISRLMDLNDPFEYLGADLSDKKFRKALQQTKVDIGRKYGILCFCKTRTHPILWGHYADKHKGICLGFKIHEPLLGKINYMDDRLEVPHEPNLEFMEKLIHTKFRHWEYEEEYRLWVPLNNKIDNLHYTDFSDELKLTQVIIGCRSGVTRAKITDALGDRESSVERFKTRTSFNSFKVVRNKYAPLWR